MKKLIIQSIAVVSLFSACGKIDIYEKNTSFSKHQWHSKDTASFTFQIIDTVHPYQLFLVLRHTDNYHFRNIWVAITAVCPDSTYSLSREFKLADNEQWLGSGMGDIYEHRIPFAQGAHKFKAGTYTFKLQQIMREDPLCNVLNAGIRLERIE